MAELNLQCKIVSKGMTPGLSIRLCSRTKYLLINSVDSIIDIIQHMSYRHACVQVEVTAGGFVTFTFYHCVVNTVHRGV